MSKKEKKDKKPMSLRAKDNLLSIASVIATITPLAVAVGINFNDYFVHTAGLQVGFGGMMSLCLLVVMVKGKSSALKGVWGYLIVFIITACLQPILDDIVLLTGMALAGKATDTIIVQPQLKKVRKVRESTQTADITRDVLLTALESRAMDMRG